MHQFTLRHIFTSQLQRHECLLLGERDTDVGLHGLSGVLGDRPGDVDGTNSDGGGSRELELLFGGGGGKIHSDYFKCYL
jgi:hypothetical protein